MRYFDDERSSAVPLPSPPSGGGTPYRAPADPQQAQRAQLRAHSLRAQVSYLTAHESVLSGAGGAYVLDRATLPARWPSGLARAAQLAIKRLIDIVASALLLLLLAPFLLAVTATIRLTSRGPVLFCQDRTGLDNVPFRIFKFRSMHVDRCDASGVSQTVNNDPRVTPIGRWLRRTNVDELPQLLNVLKGDMSLIGPRPHVPGMLAAGMAYEELVPFYAGRHQMRPGITGLAQAQGLRGPTTDPEPATLRIVRDIEYVQNFSLWLDVKIVVWTIAHELMTSSGF